VSLAEQAGGRRLIRPKSFYIVERAKSGVKKNMQLKHLACVLAKDPLILMEAYCLCCNNLVLDVRPYVCVLLISDQLTSLRL